MANDKNFVVKNSVEIGGNMTATIGTVTNDVIDLSTGNYFVVDAKGSPNYTITNAGDAQTFQLEVTGALLGIDSSYDRTGYAGTGSSGSGGTEKTITNNIDLANDGGLVWIKWTGGVLGSNDHALFDTERGVNKYLRTNSTGGQINTGTGDNESLKSFNNNGFTLGLDQLYGRVNYPDASFVSHTFKKQTKFFDVVSYTGTGTAQAISHNLGIEPGFIMVKRTDATASWRIFHRKLNGGTTPENYSLVMPATTAEAVDSTIWNNTAPTSTTFTVGTSTDTNASGGSYVAYVFAHNPNGDSYIRCDEYIGDGVAGKTVDIGFEPTLFLVKGRQSGENWLLYWATAGFYPHFNSGSFSVSNFFNESGVTIGTGDSILNGNGFGYIYLAVRLDGDPTLTWPGAINFTGGTAPSAPATGETDVYTFVTDDGGTSYIGIQSADNLS